MSPLSFRLLGLTLFLSPIFAADSAHFLKRYCYSCHQGKTPAGSLDLTAASPADLQTWNRIRARIRNREMPPKGAPAPANAERAEFLAGACVARAGAAPARIRRLNRSEYAATIRDLLSIHINAGHALPADGAGGEGFDNAGETLFLSPIHAEKYLEAARESLEYAFSDTRSRRTFLNSETPDGGRANMEAFLPRAFRRPVTPAEVDSYLALFQSAMKRGEGFEEAMRFTLEAVLISPNFLFLIPEENSDYTLASRLSYFLWSSMPDQPLFDLAAQHRLHDPAVLDQQIARMLKDIKARDFAESFAEQWLGTRELGRDIRPDAKLFPTYYDADLRSAIRYEPILFFQEIFANNLSLLNLIDSDFTILNSKLARHYGLKTVEKLGQQPSRVSLPAGSHRGGVLGMAAVLAVSSYPQRTSPVLRGKWILDAMLGTPPPPPPPNVPQLQERTDGRAPATLRDRLTAHRANAVCASCHNRIDPLGFALENYDVLGRYRTQEGGKDIDNTGELSDGTKFGGADGLKRVLLDRKELFLRNLASKMLGYALGRGLTLEDQCTVDRILDRIVEQNYSAHALIHEIVFSVPFQTEGLKR